MRRHNTRNFVKLYFNASEEEKLSILCRAKALILPSSGEVFSYTAMEAMACGTPVVASYAVPGEVLIDGVNGIRVNSLNPVDYANALERLLNNEELLLRLSRGGLSFVQGFDYVKVASRYLELIGRLLNTS